MLSAALCISAQTSSAETYRAPKARRVFQVHAKLPKAGQGHSRHQFQGTAWSFALYAKVGSAGKNAIRRVLRIAYTGSLAPLSFWVESSCQGAVQALISDLSIPLRLDTIPTFDDGQKEVSVSAFNIACRSLYSVLRFAAEYDTFALLLALMHAKFHTLIGPARNALKSAFYQTNHRSSVEMAAHQQGFSCVEGSKTVPQWSCQANAIRQQLHGPPLCWLQAAQRLSNSCFEPPL